MSEHEAKEVASAVVEWLYANGKISESVYGRMTIDGEGEDAEALAKVVMEIVN
jgi:hypothetical protein